MSNENGVAAGPDDGRGTSPRIGTVERDEAIVLLDEHWQAGRLDPAEHELRITKAKAAVTGADLDVLFADLPQGGSVPGSNGALADHEPRGFVERNRDTIVALTPFVALALFFTTHFWVWFLIVPVMGILLYGPGGKYPREQRR
ncbi:MAG: hypothetical protein QOE58_1838 [Actinomycetota bacterium]|nr:hypothetical protein [Actinomycetota bacterium]